MRWELSFRRQALGDPVSEGRRVWAWIQQVRPLHPSLDLWRPTALTWLIVGWLGCLGAGCCWDCGGCVGWGAH